MQDRFSIIDFETTRHPSGGLRAVEVAVLRVENFKVCDHYVSLVNPGCRIDSFSMGIHGIRDVMVADKPRFDAVWEELYGRLSGAPLLAHYAPFDAGVLAGELLRSDLDVPEVTWLCSCQLARRVWPGLPNHKLGGLQQALKLLGTNSHRAEADALLTAELVNRAVGELQAASPKSKAHDLLTKHAAVNLSGTWPF